MQPNEQLKILRVQKGLSEHDVARKIGLPSASYYDLEAYSDELAMTVSLSELFKLCEVLQVHSREIFGAPAEESAYTLAGLHKDVREKLQSTVASESTECSLQNWDLTDFMQDQQAAFEWNVDCLKDVALAVGYDWILALEVIFEEWKTCEAAKALRSLGGTDKVAQHCSRRRPA